MKKLVSLVLALAMLLSVGLANATTTINHLSTQFVETNGIDAYVQSIAEEKDISFYSGWYTFDEVREKTILDHVSGSSEWDLVYVDSPWVPEYAALGALKPVSELLEMEGADVETANIDDFIDVHLLRSTYKDTIYTLPHLGAYGTLAYRADLFENEEEKAAFLAEYGYELAPPKTYREFYDMSVFFTRKAGEKLAGKVLEHDFYGTCHSSANGSFLWNDYVLYLAAFGADIIVNPETYEVTWNSPESIAAVTFYRDLYLNAQPVDAINMTGGESDALFANGFCAMEIEFLNRMVSYVNDPSVSKVTGLVKYALPPIVEGVEGRDHAFLCNSNGTGVYANSKDPVAAFNVLAAALSTEGQKWMALNCLGYIPTRQSVYDDPEVLAAMPEVVDYINLVNANDVYAFAHPQFTEYAEVKEIAGTCVSKILAGADIESTMNETQEEIVKIMTKAGYYNK